MPIGVYFAPPSICAFIALGIIRGTFSVVIYFADKSFKSPSLVFLLRTPGTILLYVLLAIYLAARNRESRNIFAQNLRNVENYLKFAVMGFVQLAAPYILFMYGLKVLNPTVGGVFMAAAPWFTTVLERFPCVKYKSGMTPLKILALVIGLCGVILVSVADGKLALASEGDCLLNNNMTALSNSTATKNHNSASLISKEKCIKYTKLKVGLSLMALFGGSLMWSFSSVFWKAKRGDIHYVMAGIWNNTFAGLYALVFWFALGNNKDTSQVEWSNYYAIVSIVFLTIFSGWIAALLVNYMYKNVGPAATNRVLCLVPLFTWIEDWIFVRKFKQVYNTTLVALEVIGLVVTFSGLITSSLEMENLHSSLQEPLLRPTSDANERDHGPFGESYRGLDDGGTSEEEIDTGRLRASSPFPPLVEVRPGDS